MRYYLSLLFFFFLFFWSSRSHKEKRSSYAPEKRLRYDGIYRVEKCWRKTGIKVRCLWLFLKKKKNHHWDNQLGLCSWWTCLPMSVFCIRDLRYVDIFLLDVTMLLPHGQGLLFPSYPLSLSLSLSQCLWICDFVYVTWNQQWCSWRPSKTTARHWGVECCDWHNWKEGISILGLWCKLMLFYFMCSKWVLSSLIALLSFCNPWYLYSFI